MKSFFLFSFSQGHDLDKGDNNLCQEYEKKIVMKMICIKFKDVVFTS